MEKLGRGLVAVKSGSGTFLSWRIFGTEQGLDIAFNVYKGTTKLNTAPIATSTNYQDDSGGAGDYTVKAVFGGIEQSEAAKAMLVLENDYLEIPLKDAAGRAIHLAYVGDLDGDGEYEFIVDRVQTNASQFVDAYHRDGRFMWRVDMGPNSANTDLSLSGPATISVGSADNETVYDIDSDGKAELILKAANGTIFGDGQVLTHTNDKDMFIVAVDGKTGAEKGKRCLVPDDLGAYGNITGNFGIAYFDGKNPSLVFKGKVTTAYMLDMAFDFKDNAWSLRWKSSCTPISSYPNNHQIRCLDVDGDGMDEYVNGGYCLKDGGKVLWNLGDSGVLHGDRWHIGDLDPDRPGLEGFGIEASANFDWYTYDAKDGTILRKYGSAGNGMRGTCGDIDPAHKGYECWTNGQVFNVGEVTGLPVGSSAPPMNFRIWWDGDLLSENLDGVTISKWAYPGMPSGGFASKTLEGKYSLRNAVPLYGDIFGDWREEVLLENSAGTAIRIYTTTIVSDKRVYCLMHDPEYRNSMCEKGYQQSHMVDFYLGDGMAEPPRPNIGYPDGSGGVCGTTGAGCAGSGGTTGAGGAGSGGTTGAGGAGGGGVIVSGGAIGSGSTTSSGGGGGGLRDGGLPGTGGNAGTGGSAVVGTAGMAGADGTSAVMPETGGSAMGSGGIGGVVGGQYSTRVVKLASKSGCSCALGATPSRASPGYLVAMLACLVLNRRRRRGNFRD